MKTTTPPTTAKALTSSEQVRKGELEHTIETGKAAFLEVGQALAEIQESKLYRDEFDTFDAYCKAKWDFSRYTAYRQIGAAKAAIEVKATRVATCNKVSAESETEVTAPIARELAKAPEGTRAAVLTDATETAKASGKAAPTAKDVAAAVEKVAPKPAPTPPPKATSDPEPWNRRYHPLHDKATGLLADFKAVMVEMARLDSADAAFVGWIVEKDWRKTIDGIAATLDGHRVIGWASSAEKSRLSDNRPFLYKIDKKAGRKSA